MGKYLTFKSLAVTFITVWIVAFVFFPNLMVVVASFLTRDPHNFVRTVFTFDNYRGLMDPVWFKIFRKSFGYSLVTTLICLVTAYPFAGILTRMSKGMTRVCLTLVIIPFWTSSLIRTYALITILKANGLINTCLLGLGLIEEPLALLYNDAAVYIGLVYTLLPFMILPLYATLEKLDIGLIEAAKDLGASRFQVITKVVLPLSMPGIIAGCIMVFLPSMGLFYIPDLLGGAKSMLIGNFIKNQFLVSGNWPLGSAASVFLSLVMLVLLTLHFWNMRRFNTSVMDQEGV